MKKKQTWLQESLDEILALDKDIVDQKKIHLRSHNRAIRSQVEKNIKEFVEEQRWQMELANLLGNRRMEKSQEKGY